MKGLLVLLVAVFAFVYAQDSDVVVLTDATFEDALKNNDFIFVEFYAPWCGHCKRLAPEYEKAATALKGKTVVAKVDCTTEEHACQSQGVQGFPTLKLFRKGQAVNYDGERTADAIVNFVEKKTGPPAKVISTAEDLKAFIASKPAVVVGFFDDKDSSSYKAFLDAATVSDGFVFGEVVGNAKEVESSVTTPVVKLYRNWADTLQLVPETKSDIDTFLEENGFPTVLEIDEKTFARYSAKGNPIAALFFDVSSAATDPTFALFKQVAENLKSTISFAYADGEKFKGQLPRFGASGNVIPTVIVIHPVNQGKWPWDETKPIEKESLTQWLTDIAAGNIPSFVRSDPIPETNDEPVKVVVGKTWEQIVLDTTKDVLVEFYAPWCGHCKSLAPIYEDLAKHFQTEQNVVIAKLDGTTNDAPGIQIRGFPTLYFFPANAKSNPVQYEGTREFDDLKNFVRQHASTISKDGAHDEL